MDAWVENSLVFVGYVWSRFGWVFISGGIFGVLFGEGGVWGGCPRCLLVCRGREVCLMVGEILLSWKDSAVLLPYERSSSRNHKFLWLCRKE